VQFPDAMLWKRRWIEIDGTGHLIFTAAARHSSVSKSFNSKFHLKELGPPFIPDMDRQEMPHSVICDLVHGEGSIQCASEDAMSQRQLLSRKSQLLSFNTFPMLTTSSQCLLLTTKLGNPFDSRSWKQRVIHLLPETRATQDNAVPCHCSSAPAFFFKTHPVAP
jgi:hypothetical protein